MPFLERSEIVHRLHNSIVDRTPVLGCSAGTGISAKFAERGGADLIIIYNSGRYRMAGRGSLAGFMPYGDANGIVVEMGGEVLPIVKDTAVLAGVCATDPFRIMKVFLRQLKEMGFDGVQNFPTVGLIDGTFRTNLEESGISYDLEVEMIGEAHRMDMLTCPYVFTEEQAVRMAEVGADVIVAHMGATTKGSIGVKTAISLEEAARRIQAIHDAVKGVRSDIIVLCHGATIAEPEDVRRIYELTDGISGFFGASSIERLPTEVAIENQTRAFKGVPLRDA